MQYLVTAKQMRQYDRNTIDIIGIPELVLMERAALNVSSVVCENLQRIAGERVLILCGYGNNGADGLALARLLADKGIAVEIWCVGNSGKASDSFRKQESILGQYGLQLVTKPAYGAYTVLVDCLFGTGLSREVAGEYAATIDLFNSLSGYKIAVDIPSGLDADTGCPLGCAVRANQTVTLGFCKCGLVSSIGREYVGKITIADIGINHRAFGEDMPEAFTYDEALLQLLPNRSPQGNKGTFGKVVVVAGSVNMAGAAILCAKAAYRAGAGMVKIITPAENRVIVQTQIPEALLGTPEDLADSLAWGDVCVIGPGIGKEDEAKQMLHTVICDSALPLVIDADGLNLLVKDIVLQNALSERNIEREIVITPHPGELARLKNVGLQDIKNHLRLAAIELAKKLSVVVVAKDWQTYVCDYDLPFYVNTCGNSGMGTAGSGDVLAGFIGGFLGQSMEAFKAACVGVYAHAKVGDYLKDRIGEHQIMAGDLCGVPLEHLK